MGIFIRRPLALACVALAVGVWIGFLHTLHHWIPWITVGLLVCLLLLFASHKVSRHARATVLLVLVFFLAGSTRSLVAMKSAERLTSEHVGKEIEVELYVLEEKYASASSSAFSVRIREVNGARTQHKALLKCTYALPLYAGDTFRARVRMEAADYEDALGQNRGDGVAAVLISESSESLVYVSHQDSPLSFFHTLQDRLAFRVRRALGGEEGNLVAAILLGSDEYLSAETVRDFRRTGASHLLAISGLHVAILVGFTDRVLLFCRVGKRKRLAADLLLCLFYFLLTGCSYSLLRTLIMLGFTTLSFLLSAEGDGITSLLFGGAVILLVSPHALFDLSFQMTVLATFGILAFAPLGEGIAHRFPPRKGVRSIPHDLLRKLLSSLLITYSASVALLIIQWRIFGTLATVAPLTNILLIPLAAPLLILSLLALPLFFWPAAASVVGLLPALLAKCVLKVTSALSASRSVLSLRHGFAPYIVVGFLVLTVLLLCLELHRFRWLTLMPAVPAILAFAIALGCLQGTAVGTVEVHYSGAEERDSLTLSRVHSGVICDVAGSSASGLLADWYALQEYGVTELEVLMLTDYRMQTPTVLEEFSSCAIVRSLLLPEPLYPEDYTVQEQILAWASSEKIPAEIYRYDQPVTLFGEGTICVCAPLYRSGSALPALRVTVQMGSASLAFESCAYGECAKYLEKEQRPPCDYLVLGITGPPPREAIRTTGAREGGTVIAGHEGSLTQLDACAGRYYVVLPLAWSVRLR